jgi:hypothetical protein
MHITHANNVSVHHNVYPAFKVTSNQPHASPNAPSTTTRMTQLNNVFFVVLHLQTVNSVRSRNVFSVKRRICFTREHVWVNVRNIFIRATKSV